MSTNTNVNQIFRVGIYWGTILATLWTLAYFYAFGTEKGREWYREDMAERVRSHSSLHMYENGLQLITISTSLVLDLGSP